MSFLNLFKPPAPFPVEAYYLDTPPEEFDVNFMYDAPDSLNTKGVVLTPYIPSLHARAFHAQLVQHKSILRYWAKAPVDTLEEWCTLTERINRTPPGSLLFAVFDQSLSLDHPPPDGVQDARRLERLAGVMGVKCDAAARTAEIGHILIFPPFHRSHVTTHGVSLLLDFIFNTLALRKAVWTSQHTNAASIAAAERLGFKREATRRWHMVLPSTTQGESLEGFGDGSERAARDEEARGPGRHSVYLSIEWDEWRGEVEARVAELVARPVADRTIADLPS